jgi:hypothetical protein
LSADLTDGHIIFAKTASQKQVRPEKFHRPTRHAIGNHIFMVDPRM